MKRSGLVDAALVLRKLQRFCAFQERSKAEVTDKIRSISDLNSDACQEIVHQLIEDGFLSDARFAEAFARGKHRQNGWGKLKIIAAMKQHKLDSAIVKSAMNGIDDAAYLASAVSQAEKKLRLQPELRKEKVKLMRYLAGKGFEAEVIRTVMKTLNFRTDDND